MRWLRTAFRPTNEEVSAAAQLTASLEDWAGEDADLQAVARLERRLATVLAMPSAAPAEPRTPAWLVGLAAAAGLTVIVLVLHHGSTRELEGREPSAQADSVSVSLSALEIASRLGVGEREFARQAAFDELRSHRR